MNSYMKPLSGQPETEVPQVGQEQVSDCKPNKYAFQIKHLSHTFDQGTENEYKIFEDFNLDIDEKPGKSEIISIMGGSGCGKSCLLRMAAGLLKPQHGEIYINGESIDVYKSVPMVFQSYSSYEWMTVLDNVALPMILKGTAKKEAREKAMEILRQVGLEDNATKYAKASMLSGGQLQRISIARCLASGSRVFFLDEATGALDIKMKREIQDLILRIAGDSGSEHTIINVTHSIEEALYISDGIIVLKPNPCTIVEGIDVDYGDEPRNRGIFESSRYREYNNRLSRLLDEVCMK